MLPTAAAIDPLHFWTQRVPRHLLGGWSASYCAPIIYFLYFYNEEGWPDCPLLRASSEHIPIVRAVRARRAVWPALHPFFSSLVATRHPFR